MLGSCGGGGGGTTSPSTQTLSGVAATGAGVVGIVTLKDIPSGQIQATHTDDGSYTFNVTGLSGPFLLRVESDDHATTLYSIAYKDGSATRAQINPLTHLVMVRLGTNQPFFGNSDPGVFFDAPQHLVNLDAARIAAALDWVLDHTSPYFRQRLAANDVDVATLNPMTDTFEIGTGLDLAFDDVRFFYDPVTGESWEQSVATGDIVGAHLYIYGSVEPSMIEVAAPAPYLIPQSSLSLSVTISGNNFWQLPVGKGLRWEVSDDSLASVDANGVVTAKNFTGSHTLTVTAHYQSGDLHLQDAVTLTLDEEPHVATVDMSGLPATFDARGSYPLFTTMQLDDATGGTLKNYSGTWSLVDPDAYTQDDVSIVTGFDGLTYLVVDKPVQDLSVTLRAVQTINGVTTTTERVVTVKEFVLTPRSLVLQCPYSIEYQVPAACTAYVVNNDGTQTVVTPEVALSVSDADAAYVSASGNTLTSAWDNRSISRYVAVQASYQALTTSAQVYLNPRKTLLTSLEIVGSSEMAEGVTNTLQAWANWDDGTRTNVSSSVRWTSGDTGIATFASYPYGALTSRYIFGQESDKTVTVTIEACKYQSYWVGNCSAANLLVTTADITVRFAQPALTGLSLETGVLANGFVALDASHALQAIAIWNKKLPNGAAYTTLVDAVVTWSSNNPDAVVSGSTLTAAASAAEPLLMITASYQDPHNSGVTRTARKVVTLYSPLDEPARLAVSPVAYYYYGPLPFLLGGDGLARQISSSYDYSAGQSYSRPEAPKPFISAVKQVAANSNSIIYLRNDGTVWYPELVINTSYSAEMRQQIALQLGGNNSTIPRQIPGLTGVSAITVTNFYGTPAILHALKPDGTLWGVAVSQNNTTGVVSYTVTQQFSNVRKVVANGYAMFVLDNDGKVWSRGADSFGLGRTGSGSTYGKVVKADLTELTDIVDIAAGDGMVALDSQGRLWSWGNNGSGQLGVGDTVNRSYATQVTSVTGFTQLSLTAQAGLRSDGSLWAWGPSYMNSTEPQRVGQLSGLRQLSGAFFVAADGKVSSWVVSQYSTPQLILSAVRTANGGVGSQLVVP
ncbi:MAG: putative S-layer domain protein [Moraxellaceae bacterium]|nr:putative S-layer domain protein [Moraxellaceae bacterium]